MTEEEKLKQIFCPICNCEFLYSFIPDEYDENYTYFKCQKCGCTIQIQEYVYSKFYWAKEEMVIH